MFTDALAQPANELINQDKLDQAEALINQAQAVSWTVHSIKGHVAAKRKDWKEAAHEYHIAYNLLDESSQTGQGQDMAEIKKRHYQWASEAQLLSGTVDVIATRGGGGKMLPHTRDIGVEESIPVRFPFDSAEPTAEGFDSINKLAAKLNQRASKTDQSRGFYAVMPATEAHTRTQAKPRPEPVLVIGHTDERGSEQYNMSLSKRRAEIVVAYLKKQGVKIPLKAVGKGKSSPSEISDPSRYTQEEIWEINRRVEIVE